MEEIPQSTARFVLPPPEQLNHARSKLLNELPANGIGEDKVREQLENDVVPALNQPSRSPHFYGFVIGGATEAARRADHIVTDHDQNVHVHLPNETVCTDVEDAALRMVCDLLNLKSDDWPHRTFSTGATASNVIGLACGRDFVLSEAAAHTGQEISAAEDGLHDTMRKAGITKLQILTTVPHSSLRKAASIVGLGRSSIRTVTLPNLPHRFDLPALQAALSQPKTASIVAISCAEVNTGHFATTGPELQHIRALCDQHGAWLHIDAAFGLLARALPPNNPSYTALLAGVANLHLADSIAGDAHKLLNVPYDCGIFLSRHLGVGTSVFQNTNAAYLSVADDPAAGPTIPSPLNIGIENSRRFRALPVYATLAAYGRAGYQAMLERQIALARMIAAYVREHEAYELLNGGSVDHSTGHDSGEDDAGLQDIYIIVLFRARDPTLNANLVRKINATRRIYVSGTQWNGQPAARFAVASWMVSPERDFEVVGGILDEVAATA